MTNSQWAELEQQLLGVVELNSTLLALSIAALVAAQQRDELAMQTALRTILFLKSDTTPDSDTATH